MQGIKKIWNIICGMDKKFIQKMSGLIFSCLILIGIVSAGFMSCVPNLNTDLVSSRIDNGDRDRDDDDDDDDDDDEDDGEKCLGHETCEDICEEIYDIGRDRVTCQEEGINKVNRMDEVYDLLEGGTSRDFEKIFPGEDGVELDDLEDYLEVGISGLEYLIEDQDGWNNLAKRTNFLKWIIDEEDVAEVLNGLDDSRGHRLLEELLLTVVDSRDDCIDPNPALDCTSNDEKNHVEHYHLDTSANIHICTSNGDRSIVLDAGDSSVYNALACVHSALSVNGNRQNVFSYASIRNNDVIFNMAYDLLNSICEEVDGNEENHKIACRKALLCWTGITTLEGVDRDDNFFRDYVSNHLDGLEKDSGGSNYNQCAPRHFDDFF